MAFLNEQEKMRIAGLVRDVESRTKGELVTVLAAASDDYRYIPLLWSTLAALAVPAIWLPLAGESGLMYAFQLVVFMAASVVMSWSPVRRWIIPRSVQRRRAERLAFEAFYRLELHHTPHRAGVLLFVSVEERFVRILADAGIDDCVGHAAWQAIVEQFVVRVREGQVARGFEEAVESCGHHLMEHFPAEDGAGHKLPDVLVEVPDAWL